VTKGYIYIYYRLTHRLFVGLTEIPVVTVVPGENLGAKVDVKATESGRAENVLSLGDLDGESPLLGFTIRFSDLLLVPE
jgi:hypothetical protein